MNNETHFDCPICNNQILVENMTNHLLDHLEKECDDFSSNVNKNNLN